MKLSIIIPVFNEERYLEKTLRRIQQVVVPGIVGQEIIIVNDGSTDNTRQIFDKYKGDEKIKVISFSNNQGKARAVSFGLSISSGDIVIIQDADLEYDPYFYPQLVSPIVENKAMVVFGSRFRGQIKQMNWLNYIANKITNITLNLLFHSHISDANTGFKVFRKEILDGIKFSSKGFSLETEFTVKLLKKRVNIYEVPITYSARSRREGKKITWRQAILMYLAIFYYCFFDGR